MKKILVVLLLLVSSCSKKSDMLDSEVRPGTQAELEINIGDYVLFSVNGATLDNESRATLDRQAEWLERYRDIKIIIEGHCDERGTREYNLALGAKRANAVKDYLVAAGINPKRVATISYGKERPVVEGVGPEVWKQNRRAVTVVN
ncbi:MAG: peptidoglycan-associated lipoprotein Pal [Rickettsiales bacterium]|nr:peptidoglycan-associated lipoprotein Pal [Rickettsiales bacterium]